MSSNKVASIPYADPVEYAALFQNTEGFVFLDSALINEQGRYSYLALFPFYCAHSISLPALRAELEKFSLEIDPDLPPFQGGAAGFFSYDLVREWETLPTFSECVEPFPAFKLGFYDLVVSFDHVQKKAWAISSGLPLQDPIERNKRAQERLDFLLPQLMQRKKVVVHCSPDVTDIRSRVTREQYLADVKQCLAYIRAGDIFQVNLTQRFEAALTMTPFQLYHRLRILNPAPFAAYVKFGDCGIISSSPECFLRVENRRVETRPIKGTIKRSKDAAEDELFKNRLKNSVKDCAENTMIVDLMRNDLSKVCKPGSVNVPQLCEVETFRTVHHLVSVVEGVMQENCHLIDLLEATFPGGSITGAPKIRAMEIIEELEPTRRGPYCGSVGYIGFNGVMNTSILIRTYFLYQQRLFFQAGGAIVLDSDPVAEYEETLLKAQALCRALTEAIAEEQNDFINR